MNGVGNLVVGTQGYVCANPIQFVSYAAVWDPVKGWRNLNDLIPSGSGWRLSNAYGVSNSGQIVGFGLLNNQQRAFLMTPD